MAALHPIRVNFEEGVIASSLASTVTLMSFAAAPSFPSLGADEFVAMALIDPGALTNSEIVHMTGFTAGNTTGQIDRGQEGQVARSWSAGASWEHAPTARDLTHPEVTIAGNTAGALTIVSSGTLTLAGGNNITLSQAGNAITISGPNLTDAAFVGGISTQGNTSGTTGLVGSQVVFVGGNNVTLSQSVNGQSATLTISGANTVAQTNQTLGVYASSQTTGESSSSTIDARSLTFRGRGLVSVGLSAGEVLIDVPAGGAQTSLSFVAGGIVSTTLAGSTLTISATVPAQTDQTVGAYGLGNTSGTSSGTLDARSLSISVQGSLTVDMTDGRINFSAPNALTTAMASNRGTDFVQATAGFNGTNASGTIASNSWSVSVAAQTNQTVGLYGSSNTSGTSSGTADARSLSVQAAGKLSADMTNGRINLSVPAPVISMWPNYPTPIAMTNTIYSGSQGGGGSTSQSTISCIVFPIAIPEDLVFNEVRVVGFNSITSATTTAHYSMTAGQSLGIYTLNGANLSLLESYSNALSMNYSSAANSTNASLSWSMSFGQGTGNTSSSSTSTNNAGAAGPFSSISGSKFVPMRYSGTTTSLSAGQYFGVMAVSYITAGANLANLISQGVVSAFSSTLLDLGLNTASTTNQFPLLGRASYIGSTNSQMPNSIATADVISASNNASHVNRFGHVQMMRRVG